MGKKKTPAPPSQTDIYNRATTAYNQNQNPSELENEMKPVSQSFMNNYNNAVGRNLQDYGDIMKGYKDLGGNKFSFERVKAERPAELTESYGYLREAMPGYRDFAKTGGYSDQDIQELRARSTNPVRTAYGNTMMQMDRARALGGAGGAPNYIAAASKAQREMPGQLADAMTGINAELARDIREGKKFGLSGITGTGATMGGLSSDEANRMMAAATANQRADIETQGMGLQARMAALAGQNSLYGTTPGLSNMFGNQALNAYGQRAGLEANRNNYGLGLLDAQMRSQQLGKDQQGQPWWKTALGVAGTVAPYAAMAFSDRNMKKDIKSVGRGTTSKMAKYLTDLPLKKWKYKGDDTTHFGPMAQDFKEKFGIGDGKTLHLADVMGVILATAKETANGVA